MSAGRTCPLEYSYGVQALSRPCDFVADTLYVVGGLYGNLEALEAIFELRAAEQGQGRRVTLLFNGDFNWFNVDPQKFALLNCAVLDHPAIAGNVEAELCAERLKQVGCGCGYPEYVDSASVERSNAIIARLKATAARFAPITRAFSRLGFNAVVEVGAERVAVVHGDACSLAGWRFAAEALEPPDLRLRRALGVPDTVVTSITEMQAYFRASSVRIFASSHTCLPVAQTYEVDGRRCLLINNGAAGMPNFRGQRFGVITRISTHPTPPAGWLYGCWVGALRCDAIAVRYDHQAWIRSFLSSWPEGSPAYESYYRRLTEGPDYTLEQAARQGVELNPHALP